jgi:L-2-hydroxyglutarate oxidase LhgO
MAVKIKEIWMSETTNELQTINTAWQIAIQEILRMIVRDIYRTGGEAAFKSHIKRIEEAAVNSIYTGLMLRGTDEWTETLVKEKASNFVTTLLTSFTFDRA